jgi:hypothetical protein
MQADVFIDTENPGPNSSLCASVVERLGVNCPHRSLLHSAREPLFRLQTDGTRTYCAKVVPRMFQLIGLSAVKLEQQGLITGWNSISSMRVPSGS